MFGVRSKSEPLRGEGYNGWRKEFCEGHPGAGHRVPGPRAAGEGGRRQPRPQAHLRRHHRHRSRRLRC